MRALIDRLSSTRWLGVAIWFIGVEPGEKSIEPCAKRHDSIARTCHDVISIARLFVEGEEIEAVGVVPREKLNEILGGFELGTIGRPVLLVTDEP